MSQPELAVGTQTYAAGHSPTARADGLEVRFTSTSGIPTGSL